MSSVSRSSMRDSCFTTPLHSSAFRALQQRQDTQAYHEMRCSSATGLPSLRNRGLDGHITGARNRWSAIHTCWIEPLRRYHRLAICCPYPDSERDAHVWLAAASLETLQSCCFADRQQALLLY